MAFVFDRIYYLDWRRMEPGERIQINCDNQEKYIFEMVESGELKLDLEASRVPDGLSRLIRSNRNYQEVVLEQDIEMEDMEVFLNHNPNWKFIGGPNSDLTLYPKAPCAPTIPIMGTMYKSNAVRTIKPLENTGPATASLTERESA